MGAIADDWILSAERVPVSAAGTQLPKVPGLYVVFVDDPELLPDPFAEIAAARVDPHILYIGQASGSLYQRVWVQEFQHKSPGTFFRSVGVMLGYVSPRGGPNFEFAAPDKARIAAWIAAHLAVAWTTNVPDLNGEEHAAIGRHCPLLNISRNPKKIAYLKHLRAISQQGGGVRNVRRQADKVRPEPK